MEMNRMDIDDPMAGILCTHNPICVSSTDMKLSMYYCSVCGVGQDAVHNTTSNVCKVTTRLIILVIHYPYIQYVVGQRVLKLT